ncbi:MAG: KH domain-containing protein [Oscillospiraceae bacterium]|nr:KH domain-containing protein [Oscillospiraceae bacterium]
MKDVVLHIANGLVTKPENMTVTADETEGELRLKLAVDPDDMGKVIGRGGRTARDIRTILRAVGGYRGTPVNLEITENVKDS